MPKFNRINPAENIKNMVGMKPIVELIKSLAKITIIGFAVWGSIKTAIPDAVTLSQTSQLGFLFIVKKYAIRMLASAGGAYLALAAADYIYQWWQHEKSLKMTKEEVKQEMKQNDGDPHIKQRRRAIARSYARKQMMKDVPKADVVIVNPTHIAIAIKYDPTIAPAPIRPRHRHEQGRRAHQGDRRGTRRADGRKPSARPRAPEDGEGRHDDPLRDLHGCR